MAMTLLSTALAAAPVVAGKNIIDGANKSSAGQAASQKAIDSATDSTNTAITDAQAQTAQAAADAARTKQDAARQAQLAAQSTGTGRQASLLTSPLGSLGPGALTGGKTLLGM